jgi:hypothetical protein
MTDQTKSLDRLLKNLQEREKELNCLYTVEEILNNTQDIDKALNEIIDVIPPGWQYPESCQAKIVYNDKEFHSPNFEPSEWVINSEIEIEGNKEGEVSVYYTEELPKEYEGPFLKEERKLLNNITDRIGKYIFHIKSKKIMNEWEKAKQELAGNGKGEWQVIVNLLRKTDPEMFIYVSRKMSYYLCWNGIDEASELLQNFGTNQTFKEEDSTGEVNKPSPKLYLDVVNIGIKTFGIASKYLSDEEILTNVQKWIQESKINFMVKTLVNLDTSLAEVADAIRRFHHIMPDPTDLPISTQKSLNVSLVRRFFTDQLEFINVAKNYVDVNDMHELLQRVIYPTRSRGRLGGKSAGLFLGSRVVEKMEHEHEILKDVKTPKTWYITSDAMLNFMYSNSLEEIVEQKYKEIDKVRLEYSHIIQIFKNAPFPPEIIKGLYVALDDFGDSPLIVRSSSLLEDRLGTAFSGKYKSLFLANQGTVQEKLDALTDAIAEVYASTFGPDPIEYRAERNLLDFHEEMGIMIQEVVGTKVGNYFLPSFAGVAFSYNEFRWSPRINREDGLIRIVPGLGTRAVDRIGDDYPVLIAPGQPNLRVNVTIDEQVRYSPKRVDVINLKTNTFETVDYDKLVQEYGNEIPYLKNVVSILEEDHITKPGFMTDYSKEDFVVTFEGLRTNTKFVEQVRTIMKLLSEHLRTPVDIEFASDGEDFYLLQCRPQSATLSSVASPIPQDVSDKKIVFSANKYVSNGRVPDITHIVYVDPKGYNDLSSREEMLEVGRAVSKLNKVLPKRQFVLMGPGRWGSRGDIKLGVSVTYSDINNTAVLIEIARKKGSYQPELSFGTHFFQDLVEASIRYLPLYPDEEDAKFNEMFLKRKPNILPEILPEYAHLDEIVRVIDVPECCDGNIVRILMNAELDQALAFLTRPSSERDVETTVGEYVERPSDNHWHWRLEMATHIASQVEPERFGVEGFYVIGSAKNATSGPASDIDLLIHFRGTDEQRKALITWLEGWSLCLDEMNYLRTGYRTGGLLDVHLVTDEDIEKNTSFAAKIGAVTDAARELPLN